MKLKPMVFSAAFAMALTGQAMASESGIIYKQASSEDSNYCHMKYMAFKSETLRGPAPQFNPSEVIDRYGSCDFDPSAKEEVQSQLRIAQDQEVAPSIGGQGND